MKTSPSPVSSRASRSPSRSTRGFTLVEALISMTIVGMAMGGAMSIFVMGLKVMYRDTERLATNASLRYFIAQMSKETLDSTEFYVFPNYQALDGSVNLATDVSTLQSDAYGTQLAYGDCVVLVSRVDTDDNTSNVRQFRIYYRVAADTSVRAPIRYYESQDYGATGTPSPITTLLNTVNLRTTPAITRSRQIVGSTRGRLQAGSNPAYYYPIFATETDADTPTNYSVSVNVEVINGTATNNLLSSSSFNYTISPRK
ncbi:MAG: prepilin-type N-terminal cleavage/methylation domain-containing protein [Candidatus Didemnitutus sp.]|nr:prepilin-type N-terminal cleavage/methylation domain-containing protein [Candidatus Didemnitutus sp.]